ncbi:FK506-binding protein 15-like [Thrips palmi]|uniref:FK506-binding protein 15-like n=1 Tax=Thrips palmi TaxID=161013 RepID=A0A6P8YBP4_THRPL|nr:FK506-binding protein 15-like [Thrips palmi]
MFGAADDDDLDFNPAAGSKLASLFNVLEKSSEKGNSSLTYTAPKQPKQKVQHEGLASSRKPSLTSTSATNKLSLIVVKAVTSFKLEGGSYNPQGKLGLALLGNSESRLFQLLLYKGKQQQITSVKISPNFQFTVQPHLYASFYDDRTQNWSIMFENKDDAVEFTTQVAVARYRSAGPSQEIIITQELLPGTGDCIKENETIQLKLLAQPFQANSVQVADLRKPMLECAISHTLEASGWSAGILGAASGSVCVILVPLSVQLPWLTSKRNEPLLVETHISNDKSLNVNQAKDLPMAEEKLSKQSTKVDSAADSSTEDSSVLSRSASIKEALSNSPRSNKASIISRMARMGQATLPLKGAITCNPSDSEETEDDTGTVGRSKPPPKAYGNVKLRSALRQQVATQPSMGGATPAAMAVVQTPVHWNQHQQNLMPKTGNDGSMVQIVSSEGQLFSLNAQQQLPIVATTSTMMSPTDTSTAHMSMFLSEARIQNTEMRMNLSKFGDKIDHLITKVDNLQMSSGSPSPTTAPAIGLEPNALLFSIEKLVKDNQSLNMEIAEKNKRLDEQNERIFSLLNTNSKFLEQSGSLLEQKQLQEQNKKKHEEQIQQQELQAQLIQQIREEKIGLGNQLASLQNQLASVQELVQALQKSNKELNQELEVMRSRLQEKESNIRDMEMAKQNSVGDDAQLNQALEIQKKSNSQLQDQISNLIDQAKTEKDKFKNLEQEHMMEVNELKSQLRKLSDSHAKVVSNLEIKCKEANELLLHKPKQVEDGSALLLENMITDVKLLMNTLHKGLNQQFAPDQSYDGTQIRSLISAVVKREALLFVGKMEKQCTSANNSSEISRGLSKFTSSSAASSNVVMKEDQKPKELAGPADDEFFSGSTQNKLETSVVQNSRKMSENESISNIEKLSTHSLQGAESLSDGKEKDPSMETTWRPSPPPPPLFHDEDDSDDWLT